MIGAFRDFKLSPDCYLDDIKIKLGEALYTENFTPTPRS